MIKFWGGLDVTNDKRFILCPGARRLAYITIMLVIAEVIYILFYVKGMSGAEMIYEMELLRRMISDTLGSILVSLGGVIAFDLCYKYYEKGK